MEAKARELSSRYTKTSLKQKLHPIKWVRNNVETFKMVFKMAAPPAMVAALIESSYWVDYFEEYMYIMAIISYACVTPGLPRAALISLNWKFSVAWALCYSWALLAGWCAVQARKHTGELDPYSPSASAILAMFLMFACWVSYGLKSLTPQLTLVLITCTSYFVATMPALIELTTTREVINTASLVLECFLAGQAIGVAIGLIFFPRSSRTAFMTSVESSLLALSSVITEQPGCLERLVHHAGSDSTEGLDAMNQLKSNIDAFITAVTKVQTGLKIAGQEWTYSHLSRGDLKTIADQLTMISAPLAGLKSLVDKVMTGLSEVSSVEGEEAAGEHKEFVSVSKHYAEELAASINDGIKHALACLGSRSSSSAHVDAACLKAQCHHVAFFQETLLKYRTPAGELSMAAEQYLMKQLIRDTRNLSTSLPYGALLGCFLSSHLIQLLSATGYEFQQLLLFLDESSHQKRRVYTPIQNLFSDLRIKARVLMKGSSNQMLYGAVFSGLAPKIKHDVDHLPPSTFLEKFGDFIRRFWKIFSSGHAAFGIRGALAVMTIAILAFLKDEHAFYNEQRFLWALFSIALCLDRTSGSSSLKLIFRFFATLASMVASYIIWYIVDQQVAGVIVFLFVWYCVVSWCQLKSAKYAPAAFTALVTATVMIDNQLQVKKLGAQRVVTSGQAVYESYILFPFRLAQVTLGIFVAYFWTLFPSPLPEHTELRLQAAEAVLNLATYSSSVHQSVSIQFGAEFSKVISSPEMHLHRLRSRHRAHLTEHTILIRQMQGTMKTLPYEFSLGGKFPLKAYRAICACISQLGDIFTLIGYISHTLNGQQLARNMNSGDQEVLHHLCPQGMGARLIILCSALRTGHPLPPVLHVLHVPDLRHFLDRRVATDESFASASLIHSANFMAMRSINELTELISDVVGVLDFTLPLAELDNELDISVV